jgi:hypothetical protein
MALLFLFPFLGIWLAFLTEGFTRCGVFTSLPLLRRLLPSLPNLLLQTPLFFTSCRGFPEKATPQKSNKICAPEKRSRKRFFRDITRDFGLLCQKTVYSRF